MRHGNSRSLDRRANWLEALAVFGLAAAVLLHYISLNAPPFWDELYHLLAARSWLTEGTFRIVDGEYRRGAVVTITTGLMYRVFGESLFVARILPALFGCIWVLVVFLWTRRVAGRLEAWIVAVLLIGSSWMLELSGMVRFYSLHGITFWIGAIALWTAVRATGWRARLLWGGVAVAALYLACSIYLLSVIGVGGLVLWAFVTVLVELPKEKRGYALLAAAGLVAASVLVLVGTGQLSVLLGYYAWSPKWAVGRWDSDLFYHRLFELFYPTLYTLLPLGAAFAIARKPRVGTMALIVFGVVVLVASFAGVKALRYVFYAVPFFFLIWAITVAELLPSLSRLFSTAVAGVIGAPMNGWRQRGVEVAALTATGLFIIATNGAFTQTYRLLTGSYVPGTHPTPDWSAAADSLRALSTRAEIVVTSVSGDAGGRKLDAAGLRCRLPNRAAGCRDARIACAHHVVFPARARVCGGGSVAARDTGHRRAGRRHARGQRDRGGPTRVMAPEGLHVEPARDRRFRGLWRDSNAQSRVPAGAVTRRSPVSMTRVSQEQSRRSCVGLRSPPPHGGGSPPSVRC